MKIKTLMILGFLAAPGLQAQLIKERSIDLSVGMGLSAPYDEYDAVASGLYAQAEYVLHLASWIDARGYAGLIRATHMEEEVKEKGFKTTANAGVFGIKSRLMAPIPWFAPYIEGGFGISVGSFHTSTPYTEKRGSGLLMHYPFTLGVALGKNHPVNVEFTYYFHDSVQQFSGAAAIGLSIPLKN